MARFPFAALAVSALALAALGGGAYVAWRLGISSNEGDEVGGVAALRPVQEELAGVPACAMSYRSHARHPDHSLLLESCDARPVTAWLALPRAWPYREARFRARRGKLGERWQIFVDKERVPLDQLAGALTTIAPLAADQGARELAKAQASREAYERTRDERERGDRERRAQSRRSYDDK